MSINMVEKVTQHAHCQMCGKAIPTTETLCSEECKQKFQGLMKKRKLYLYIIYGAIFVILIAYALAYMQ